MTATMRETEAGFTKAVLDLAKMHRWRAMHQRPAMTSKGWRTAISGDAGFPDLVLVRGTRLIFAELKVGKNKPTTEQFEWLARLMGAGAECYVWRPEQWDEIAAKLEVT